MSFQKARHVRHALRHHLLAGVLLVAAHGGAYGADEERHVGSQTCQPCHQAEYQAWQGSDHEKAMQAADGTTVLGDFNNARYTHHGVTTTFFRKDGKYMVRTDGKDGKLQDYEIRYTFGVEPLQQYLIAFPGGHYQALGIAWDSRPRQAGGQRWFHLHPDEKIGHNDELHWTGIHQNWNGNCAECHSTHLQKNYDPETKTFNTRWSEIHVACEACHGPGSKHVQWAKRAPGWEKDQPTRGLNVLFDERAGVRWKIDDRTGNATRSKIRVADKEIEVCARCHSRRSAITDHDRIGDRFLDHYKPRLLDEGMYHVDGQINDEVYVYGSFLQSRMYHAGVTCSDCHEPHTLKLRAAGNGVCLPCHAANQYNHTRHHHHQTGSTGSQCVECHMPAKTYMVVDPRRDHSIRIPRPDRSVQLNTPNACNHCHREKDAQWAAVQFKKWYGQKPTRKSLQDFASAFSAARNVTGSAGSQLAGVIRDPQAPAIARATALADIGPYLNAQSADVLSLGVNDKDPLVRAATLRALEYAPTEIRARFAFSLLDDPVRLVRIEAARVLAVFPGGELPEKDRAGLEQAMQEYLRSQLANADRPEAQTNLGNLYVALGKTSQAETAFQTALTLNPAHLPAYVNYADFYRARKQEGKAEQVLRGGIKRNPDSAVLHHALGLSLVRQQQQHHALEELRLALTLDSKNARYAYVYAVALHATGATRQAVDVLHKAQQAYPDNRDVLGALAAFHHELGEEEQAQKYAKRMRTGSP